MIEDRVLTEAVELFNRKLYFECHDLLEEEWVGARGEERAFLNALIHAAVGMYHVAGGNHAGAASQLAQAVKGLTPLGDECFGLDVAALLRALESCLDKAERLRRGERIEWSAADLPRMTFREARSSA